MKQVKLSSGQRVFAEVVAGMALVSWMIFFLGPFRRGETVQVHDNIYWDYPIFKFFAVGLLNGEIPFWNPYTHGGEPFYLTLVQERLLEPTYWLTILSLRRIIDDSAAIFNLTRVVAILLSNFGIYLCVRLFTRHLVTRFCVIAVLTLSSLLLLPFRQSGMYFQFQWSGFLLYFYLRGLRNEQFKASDIFGMALALGLSWQSYWFASIWNLVIVFSIGSLLFVPKRIFTLIRQVVFDKRAWLATVLMLSMTAPNFILWRESDQYQFPSRSVLRDDPSGEEVPGPAGSEGSLNERQSGMKMSWDVVRNTGTPALIWDLLRIVNTEGNKVVAEEWATFFGDPSDAIIYLSLLVIFFSLVGLVEGKDPLKKPLVFTFIVFLFLVLGQFGGLHKLLYPILPTLWFSRHMAFLVAFIGLFFLIFFVMGMERWLAEPRVIVPEKSPLLKFSLTMIIFVVSGAAQVFLLLPQYFSYDHAWLSLLLFLGAAMLYRLLQPPRNVSYWVFLSLVAIIVAGHFDRWWLISNRILPLVVLPLMIAIGVTTLARGKGFSLVPVLMLLTVFVDLNIFFSASSKLYAQAPNLESKFGLDTKLPRGFTFPATRYVAEPSSIMIPMHQFIRYFSLLDQNSYVFSALTAGVPDGGIKETRYRSRVETFYLSNDYVKLVQGSLSDRQLEDVFAVRAPTVQFKTTARNSAESASLPENYFANGITLPESINVTDEKDSQFIASTRAFTANQFDLDVKNTRKGWLYWADSYHPYWNVTVDGQTQPVLKANQGFKAVALEPGVHRVIFNFSPTPFVIALRIYLVAFALLSGGFLTALVGQYLRIRVRRLDAVVPAMAQT